VEQTLTVVMMRFPEFPNSRIPDSPPRRLAAGAPIDLPNVLLVSLNSLRDQMFETLRESQFP
jgi:hypothetical protein